jgi:transposase
MVQTFNQRRTAMNYYTGLDVSLNSTAICVVNYDGTIIREGDVPSEPAAIHEWLKKLDLPMERVGLEAGGLSPWLCHELLALGWPVICIETRHAKAAMKAQLDFFRGRSS